MDRVWSSAHLIAAKLAKDLLRLSFVEGEGFSELMNYAAPKYDVPSHKTITSMAALYARSARAINPSPQTATIQVLELSI